MASENGRSVMQKSILIVDDDTQMSALIAAHLGAAGYQVRTANDSSFAMGEIFSFNPDVIILDLRMPGVAGIELLTRIRQDRALDRIKIIVYSAKSFKYDYRQCIKAGADAYLVKPVSPQELMTTITNILADAMKVTFWGTRGSIARPGRDTLKYGGNTSCVSVEFTRDRWFVFDAGTGIVDFGRSLIAGDKSRKINIFISHPHWDHIQGLPFFLPLYQQGNEVAIHGTSQGKLSLQEVIRGQMDAIYFPVTIREFSARVYFNELAESEYEIEKLRVRTLSLNHPGMTLGYVVTNATGKSVAYITDNEIVPGADVHNRNRLVTLLSGVDVLIHDANYLDGEYPGKVGWGHSPVTEVLKLAADAKVKRLYLFHHDPHHDDNAVEKKEAFGKCFFEERGLDIECFCAMEGHSISL